MRIQTYTRPEDFMAVAGPVLAEDEVRNNLMLGIAERLLGNPNEYGSDPFFATVHDGGGIALVGLMTPPFPLQFRVFAGESTPVDALVTALLNGGWEVSGVMASPDEARYFAERWSSARGGGYRPGMASRLHALHNVNPIQYSAGEYRLAQPADVETIVAWIEAFHDESIPDEPFDPARVRRNTEKRIAAGEIGIWVDPTPVSMAFRSRAMASNESVSGVYTPRDLRGRGYATSCVATLSQSILDSGKRYCCLFTDLANPTSNKIYARIGYEPVADFQNYRFVEGAE